MSKKRQRVYVVGVIVAGAASVLSPAGCSSPYGSNASSGNPLPEDASVEASPDASPLSPVDGSVLLPECGAQRTVHLIAGNGGLAWFTLLWPVPLLITNPQATDAFDDPTKAAVVAETSAAHPLYARKIGARSIFAGLGAHPHPSVFVAGSNETHTNVPSSTITFSAGSTVVAAGAVAQKTLDPKVPVLGFGGPFPYGTAPGAPPLTSVVDVDAAVALMKTTAGLTAAQEQDLRPNTATLAVWGIDTGSPKVQVDLAQMLLFAANAFRLGLVGSVLIPAVRDDPHGAFDSSIAGVTADRLARIVDGFYAELAKANEAKCGHRGAPLSLADNVVLIVNGDTPKNMFARAGWADGTPQNSNLLFVRANGWLEPGWFGQLAPSVRTNFDPMTGATSAGATAAASGNAALGGVLYAISRGNQTFVSAVSSAPYQGVLAPSAP